VSNFWGSYPYKGFVHNPAAVPFSFRAQQLFQEGVHDKMHLLEVARHLFLQNPSIYRELILSLGVLPIHEDAVQKIARPIAAAIFKLIMHKRGQEELAVQRV
jgi:hypothetical protein